MKENNKLFETPVRSFLEALIGSPQEHARFMNMLSMLEHRGSCKIMIAQAGRKSGEDLREDCFETAILEEEKAA